jgi:hypothetical protein
MTIKKFAVLGERCSGTNYLEELIKLNFGLDYANEYGSKHFFCFRDYNNLPSNDETLFIGIIRNPIYWINSFSKELYHVPEINRKSMKNFLFNEFYSVCDEVHDAKKNDIFMFNTKQYVKSYEINKEDLNYMNGKKYKNIFELRKNKNNYLMKIMPTKVKNYILINYENLLFNLNNTLEVIMNKFNLIREHDIFMNIQKYKKTEHYHFIKQRTVTFDINTIKIIWDNLDEVQELFLGYIKFDNNNTFKTNKWSGVFIENLSQP